MPDDTTGRGDESQDLTASTRRKLLGAIGVTGTAALAGCGGDGGGDDETTTTTTTETEGVPGGEDLGGEGDEETETETETETATETATETEQGLPHVSGQTLIMPTSTNPEEAHWLNWGSVGGYTEHAFDFADATWDAIMEPAVYGRFQNSAYYFAPGETFFRLYEDVEITDELITVTIKDDAVWSDGQDIRAYDAAGTAAMWRLAGWTEDRGWPGDAKGLNIWHSWQDVRMPDGPDGKVYELHSPRGLFGDAPKGELFSWGLLQNRAGIGEGPTHVEPMKSMAEEALESIEGLQEGGTYGEDWFQRVDIGERHTDPEDVEKFAQPENVVSNGAWTPAEKRGTQAIVLEPNEYWRHSDEVNFDKIRYEFIDDDQRLRAQIQADAIDYGSGTTPVDVAQGFPDNIEQVTTPSGWGGSLGFNHAHFAFGDHRVRKAIMYALDKPAIAGNVHPEATKPVSIAGGDMWARDAILSDEWVEQNLTDYSQDLEKANALMQEAGFEKQDGTWAKDGQTIEGELPTTSETRTAIMETTVADQLGDFGINLQVQNYDQSTYNERWDNGEFDIWRTGWLTGFYDQLWVFWWGSINHVDSIDTWNLYDKDKQQEATEGYGSGGWVEGQWPLWEDLEIQAPPIGEPDGELQTYTPSWSGGRVWRGPGDYTEDFFKKFAWIANWYLAAVPVFQQLNQNFIDSAHWNWPKNHYMWDYFGVSTNENEYASMNMIQANPDDPEEGASVE